jgi:hypothetical protein
MPDTITSLQEERDALQKKLSALSAWATRDIRSNISSIAKQRASGLDTETHESFHAEETAEDIEKKITEYFGNILLLNAPNGVVDALTTAEVNYYNLLQNPSIDGLSVVSAYHKALDAVIESYITKWFRKFAKKKWQDVLRKNDPLEKTLHLVVNKWYILWFGRLYWLIKYIKQDWNLYDYGECFAEYLDKYYYLKDILLEENFFGQMTQLANSEVLWAKRHTWNIKGPEALKARELFIGNYENKNSIIYKLLESQSVEF